MQHKPLPVLNRAPHPRAQQKPSAPPQGARKPRRELSRTEIDFVVERIIDKHTEAMREELKTVLGVLVGGSDTPPRR